MSFDVVPIRCYECGRLISCLENEYKTLLDSGLPAGEALDAIGLTDPCCRTYMFIPSKFPLVDLDLRRLYGVTEARERQASRIENLVIGENLESDLMYPTEFPKDLEHPTYETSQIEMVRRNGGERVPTVKISTYCAISGSSSEFSKFKKTEAWKEIEERLKQR